MTGCPDRFDASTQYRAYIEYAYRNTYRPLITSSEYSAYMSDYESQCAPAMARCTSAAPGSGAEACIAAEMTCELVADAPIEDANDFDVYDVRAPAADPNPPRTYVGYLQDREVADAIGAVNSTYTECSEAAYDKFELTGDGERRGTSRGRGASPGSGQVAAAFGCRLLTWRPTQVHDPSSQTSRSWCSPGSRSIYGGRRHVRRIQDGRQPELAESVRGWP